ncbi:MAG: DUF2513 domain-containing protein [Ignavibacteriaceae bacterium]
MKREIELIRKIFFELEKFPAKIESSFDYSIKVKNYSKEIIDYHLVLMQQANFIQGIIQRSVINKNITIYYDTLEITWEGHEFLDTIRHNKVWKYLKEKTKNSDIPFTVIKELGKTILVKLVFPQSPL